MRIETEDIGEAWISLLEFLVNEGKPVSPRQLGCHEITGVTLHLREARRNVLVCAQRRPSYKFMVAEWLWIWFGRDDVKTISYYNSHIAKFSDNGVDFNGAYGVPVKAQWPYILDLLTRDPDTRQAVIVIYKPPQGPTKDVPCTISAQFLLREGKLHTIVNMRSSDVWLGLPYDIFNFTMLANVLSAQLHVELGHFTINLGSSHLYDTNLKAAEDTLIQWSFGHHISPQFKEAPPIVLDEVLSRATAMGELSSCLIPSPWTHYAQVLLARNNEVAERHLYEASQL